MAEASTSVHAGVAEKNVVTIGPFPGDHYISGCCGFLDVRRSVDMREDGHRSVRQDLPTYVGRSRRTLLC